MLNGVLDKKEAVLVYKTLVFQSFKNRIFPMILVRNVDFFFLYLFLVKVRLKIIYNDVLDEIRSLSRL